MAAWECDPVSAFGGVVALNRPLDEPTSQLIADAGFIEVLIAPEVGDAAATALSAKPTLRLLQAAAPAATDLDMRRLEDGFVVQPRDQVHSDDAAWSVVGTTALQEPRLVDLRLAWLVAAHTKSNAIVIVRDGAAVGVGAGDQSRVGAAHRALERAGDRARGGVAASDAFLPFRDTVDSLAAAGVTALVEPGGSKRDDEVIAAANEHGMALVSTGERHFRH